MGANEGDDRPKVSRLKGIGRTGFRYEGPEPEGTIYLDHSCAEWIIGNDKDAKKMIRGLMDAIEERKKVLAAPKKGILKRAEKNGWKYYCKEHDFGESNWSAMWPHNSEPHKTWDNLEDVCPTTPCE